jgi:tetratricopeptide (TPR) repeat protein
LREAAAIATVLEHPLARAEEAVRLAQADARAARRLAASALADAGDAEARSTAERALGLAAIELGDAAGGVAHLRRAVRTAEGAGLRRRAAEARMSLSLALTLQGATAEALSETDRAAPDLDGWAGARLGMQRALILQKLGRLEEALDGYRAPLAVFRRRGDALWEARLLCNRGVLQVYRGALGAARADFVRAEGLHASIGQALAATQVRHNLGWLSARRGDVPEALAWYDRVEAEYREHGVPLALLLMDRAEVLLSARLAAEARDAAERAATELDAAGQAADLAEALLLAAQAELLAGDPVAARAHATRAAGLFTRQRRPAWAALARAAGAQAAWLEATADSPPAPTADTPGGATRGDSSRAATPADAPAAARLEDALGAAQRAARSLEAAGWGVETLDARVIAGRAALALGRTRLARRQLGLAGAARHKGPVQVAMRAWHAEALLRLSREDRRGAGAAVAAGLRALEAHRVTLGATELRAQASGHGEELATLGLRLAMDSGSPARVLAAAERRRAAGLLLRPARPPDDAELAADLAELRRVSATLDAALREGGHDPELRRRQATLEASIRRRARRARGAKHDASDTDRIPTVAELSEILGERALAELVRLDGRLHAVTVVDGRARLRALAAAADVDKELESLRFSLRSLAMARPGSLAAASMGDVCAQVAARLDALLIAPLHHDIGDRPLVLIPSGELHALPWSMLPSLAHRPLAIGPSLRLWARAARHPAPAGAPGVLVAGPRLPAAAAEVDALRARHPDALSLTGDRARVAAVAAALDGADSAHVAAHGRFRDDNPLFCSLELADGALTVYDLERLRRAPRRLVLSSCESGLSAVHAGDELMGFTAAVFALGTATVVAAVVPVPDEATSGLMLALDDELRTGTPPALALVRARERTAGDDRRRTVARAAFVCFGAG